MPVSLLNMDKLPCTFSISKKLPFTTPVQHMDEINEEIRMLEKMGYEVHLEDDGTYELLSKKTKEA